MQVGLCSNCFTESAEWDAYDARLQLDGVLEMSESFL